ncbi:hypothetical protein S7711_11250 [Stachybotrys chartarum IBT 7711]|uniref:Uncharacterized protein n=1 Tax=Stachybotrys chartarum (strain CBS 109288 / IBT 7711) TaxID=1280523 RepID=A0A084ART2_STACB|nr:hypothetical protein S7711_11250 [Stachybotrys chartarum IBT 7711]
MSQPTQGRTPPLTKPIRGFIDKINTHHIVGATTSGTQASAPGEELTNRLALRRAFTCSPVPPRQSDALTEGISSQPTTSSTMLPWVVYLVVFGLVYSLLGPVSSS